MTTPDPVALREALEKIEAEGDDPFLDWLGLPPVVAAARWALDLIEGGKEVSYCLTHGTITGCPFDPRVPCNMVKRLLVTPVSETARETYLRTAHAGDEPGSRDSSAR